MKRIVIIGSCGSGKTTLARHLAENLDYPVTDLDDLYWLPNWTLRPKEEFASLIEKATRSDCWIICGNQSKFRHLIWPKADTIIWLDLPLHILLRRVLVRSLQRICDKKPICNGNYETFSRLFCSKSIFYWLLKSYFRHRRDYSKQMKTMTNVKWIHTRKSKGIRFLDPHF
ncbi:MAG: adenylate kinase [Chlamydiales bacterium]|nr:adenylate kinase [Chlamydiia bacterium]MCP5503781.1 adenylate kinase [Chlamydiales bacterium]